MGISCRLRVVYSWGSNVDAIFCKKSAVTIYTGLNLAILDQKSLIVNLKGPTPEKAGVSIETRLLSH